MPRLLSTLAPVPGCALRYGPRLILEQLVAVLQHPELRLSGLKAELSSRRLTGSSRSSFAARQADALPLLSVSKDKTSSSAAISCSHRLHALDLSSFQDAAHKPAIKAAGSMVCTSSSTGTRYSIGRAYRL